MSLVSNVADVLTDKSVIFAFANTIYCLSYVLTSMLWLRVLAVVGAASTLPYFFLQAEPLYQALFWQSMFLTINLVNLIILLYSMRAPKLSQREQSLLENVFVDLKPHEAVPLLNAAETLYVSSGEVILQAGEENDRLYLLVEGNAIVSKGGKDVADLGNNSFIGEMSFISGDPVSATVRTTEDSLIYIWRPEKLQKLFKKQSLYRMYFYQLCGVDMAGKLRAMKSENLDYVH
ncbi:MAG: cyclic nucleotide-binding domain-containing protein [Acidiferrobacterales bacterium]|nr:cyclic nucleotide-binding domain-containing protein [Acidiferrobacterales bacterium]